MRFRRTWKAGRPPSSSRYEALFNQVWDRYVEVMESEYGQQTTRPRTVGIVQQLGRGGSVPPISATTPSSPTNRGRSRR
jgi:hypothetical protein